MKELDCIIIDDTEYAIMNEVIDNDVKYVFLVNPNNHSDIMIRKLMANDDDSYLPLANEEEFNLACMLLFKDSVKAPEE